MWQKTIAGMLVITGAFGFGRALCQDMNCILFHLKEQKRIILYIINEISFLHKPMQEIFEAMEEKLNGPYRSFIGNIVIEMKKGSGRNLEEIWDKEIKKIKAERIYPKIAIENLFKFSKCFGKEKDQMQMGEYRLLELELDEEIKRLIKEKEEKSKLIQTLSILAGVFCVVLFI